MWSVRTNDQDRVLSIRNGAEITWCWGGEQQEDERVIREGP